jgi:hypothetical protein
MLYKISWLLCIHFLFCSSALIAQSALPLVSPSPDSPDQHSQSETSAGFKPSDSSISCSVVRYDKSEAKPVLHLLCPEEQVFAPLRVHLSLSWNDMREIPSHFEHMLVDIGSLAQLKSKLGDTEVKLRLRENSSAHPLTRWIRFTMVTVGLVKQK